MVEVEPLLDQILAISQQSTLQTHTGVQKGVRGGEGKKPILYYYYIMISIITRKCHEWLLQNVNKILKTSIILFIFAQNVYIILFYIHPVSFFLQLIHYFSVFH